MSGGVGWKKKSEEVYTGKKRRSRLRLVLVGRQGIKGQVSRTPLKYSSILDIKSLSLFVIRGYTYLCLLKRNGGSANKKYLMEI